MPGLDAVLAALMSHAQQNAAGGSKQLAAGALAAPAASSSKHEAVEVSCLSAVQEQHSSARALPLLIRLYFNSGSRAEVCVLMHTCRALWGCGKLAPLLSCSSAVHSQPHGLTTSFSHLFKCAVVFMPPTPHHTFQTNRPLLRGVLSP